MRLFPFHQTALGFVVLLIVVLFAVTAGEVADEESAAGSLRLEGRLP